MISTHDPLTRLLALAELAVSEALEFDYGDPEDCYIWRELQELKGLVAAAMTQPEPEGPTEEEIMDLMPQLMHEDLASAARAMAAQAGTDNRNVAGMMRIILNHHAVDLARIVLARWGTPAIKPVPVSLRLPGEGDCDPEGMCWWFSPEDAGVGQFGVAACWVLRQRGKDDDWLQAWLPHYALPVPSSIHD